MQRVELQPAVVLHSRQYRETSLLVDCFTRDYGRLSLIARGARKGKNAQIRLLQPFQAIALSFQGKSSLKTLLSVELVSLSKPLEGKRLYCGYYLNELLLRLLPEQDAHSDIFEDYLSALSGLRSVTSVEFFIRRFEWQLLNHLGYCVSFRTDTSGLPISSQAYYRLTLEQGFIATAISASSYPGEAILALAEGRNCNDDLQPIQKRLMRELLKPHLGNKPLRSRQMFIELFGQPLSGRA